MKAGCCIIVTLILWGLIPIIDKKGLSGEPVSSWVGMTIRVFSAFLVMAPFLVFSSTFNQEFRALSWKTIFIFSASGVISMIISQCFYYEALKEKEVSRLFPILFGGAPVISMLFGWAILGEKITVCSLAGGILIAIGSILMLV